MIYLTKRQEEAADAAIKWVVEHFENCDTRVPVKVSTALFVVRRKIIRSINEGAEPLARGEVV